MPSASSFAPRAVEGEGEGRRGHAKFLEENRHGTHLPALLLGKAPLLPAPIRPIGSPCRIHPGAGRDELVVDGSDRRGQEAPGRAGGGGGARLPERRPRRRLHRHRRHLPPRHPPARRHPRRALEGLRALAPPAPALVPTALPRRRAPPPRPRRGRRPRPARHLRGGLTPRRGHQLVRAPPHHRLRVLAPERHERRWQHLRLRRHLPEGGRQAALARLKGRVGGLQRRLRRGPHRRARDLCRRRPLRQERDLQLQQRGSLQVEEPLADTGRPFRGRLDWVPRGGQQVQAP
ncbi:hypothetical protein PVAP13_1NG488119 [Panicum virgatum]|uniref:Uncharacterized protein n=1 Tax=Panicum virgatum TaxID=38727 RepID=A0A8T0X472_PANVG|nr:hypothetical protein PVAP13_1NG488119 [Panicum virgatum]